MKLKLKEFPKECPFCHDVGIIVEDPCPGYKGYYQYYVACMNGSCKVQPRTKPYNDIYNMTKQECVDMSIDDWNKR